MVPLARLDGQRVRHAELLVRLDVMLELALVVDPQLVRPGFARVALIRAAKNVHRADLGRAHPRLDRVLIRADGREHRDHDFIVHAIEGHHVPAHVEQ